MLNYQYHTLKVQNHIPMYKIPATQDAQSIIPYVPVYQGPSPYSSQLVNGRTITYPPSCHSHRNQVSF